MKTVDSCNESTPDNTCGINIHYTVIVYSAFNIFSQNVGAIKENKPKNWKFKAYI